MDNQIDREELTKALRLSLDQNQVDALADITVTTIHAFFYHRVALVVLISQVVAFSAGWMWATYDDGRIILAILLTLASLVSIVWVLIPAANEVEVKVANIVDSFAEIKEASTTRKCPFCAEEILKEAVACKHCGRTVSTAPTPSERGYRSHPITIAFMWVLVLLVFFGLVSPDEDISSGLMVWLWLSIWLVVEH